MRTIRIATRKSALALIQARIVADGIKKQGHEIELVAVTTLGDRVTDRSLSAIGGDGVFVKELERDLLDGRADVAVHSLKDLPTETDPRLRNAAMLEREDPRDALVSVDNRHGSLASVPRGAVVGTSSLRRRAQLLAIRPDLEVRDIRGNVETRVRKVIDGTYDASVLALSGLRRAGLLPLVGGATPLSVDEIVPAPGQGAICAQCRNDDEEVLGLLAQLDHAATAAAVEIERALLRRMGGGCLVPIGAHATVEGSSYSVVAVVSSVDGTSNVRKTAAGSLTAAVPASVAGERLADELLEAGGRELVDRFRSELARER